MTSFVTQPGAAAAKRCSWKAFAGPVTLRACAYLIIYTTGESFGSFRHKKDKKHYFLLGVRILCLSLQIGKHISYLFLISSEHVCIFPWYKVPVVGPGAGAEA